MSTANTKSHVKKTRTQEKSHVQHAQTRKFKESTLIYNNLLNQHEKWKLKALENMLEFSSAKLSSLIELSWVEAELGNDSHHAVRFDSEVF